MEKQGETKKGSICVGLKEKPRIIRTGLELV